jgi:hypothetical protein
MAKKLLALAATFALGALITTGVFALRPDRQPLRRSPGIRDFMAIFDPSQPLFIDGGKTTYEGASQQAGYLIPIPGTLPAEIAGAEPEVWYSDVTNETGLRYGSQLVLNYTPWPASVDAATMYKQEATDWAGEATDVGGNPAWVIAPSQFAKNEPPTSVVHVSISGVDITLLGQMSLDELILVAGSLQPSGQVLTGPGH